MRRFAVGIALIGVAATMSVCGGTATSSSMTAAARRSASLKADQHLARQTLAAQLAAVKQGGGWHTVRRPKDTSTGTDKQSNTDCTSAGARAYATSPFIEYHGELQLQLEDDLYPDAAMAKKALRLLGSKRAADCFEKVAVTNLRNFSVGTAQLDGPRSVKAGAEARAAGIIVPFTDKGQLIREHIDYVFARSGRNIVLVNTEAYSTNLPYDVKLAAWIAQLSSTVRAAHPRGWTPTIADAQRCKHWAANKANLGAPIVYTRASYTAVLFVDRNDDYTAFCSYTGTAEGTDSYDSNDEPAIPSDGAPSADAIQDPQVEGRRNCELSKGLFRGIPNLGTTYGFAGSNVASVTFHFVHEPSIDALVKRGFYIASWPYREWFEYVTVRTKSGTNTTVQTKSPLPSKLACHPGTIVLGST